MSGTPSQRIPWPVPPGTPEAKAAIERVKRALAEESRMLATFTIPGARRTRRQPPRACRTCHRPVRTPGQDYCYRHRASTSRAARVPGDGRDPHRDREKENTR